MKKVSIVVLTISVLLVSTIFTKTNFDKYKELDSVYLSDFYDLTEKKHGDLYIIDMYSGEMLPSNTNNKLISELQSDIANGISIEFEEQKYEGNITKENYPDLFKNYNVDFIYTKDYNTFVSLEEKSFLIKNPIYLLILILIIILSFKLSFRKNKYPKKSNLKAEKTKHVMYEIDDYFDNSPSTFEKIANFNHYSNYDYDYDEEGNIIRKNSLIKTSTFDIDDFISSKVKEYKDIIAESIKIDDTLKNIQKNLENEKNIIKENTKRKQDEIYQKELVERTSKEKIEKEILRQKQLSNINNSKISELEAQLKEKDNNLRILEEQMLYEKENFYKELSSIEDKLNKAKNQFDSDRANYEEKIYKIQGLFEQKLVDENHEKIVLIKKLESLEEKLTTSKNSANLEKEISYLKSEIEKRDKNISNLQKENSRVEKENMKVKERLLASDPVLNSEILSKYKSKIDSILFEKLLIAENSYLTSLNSNVVDYSASLSSYFNTIEYMITKCIPNSYNNDYRSMRGLYDKLNYLSDKNKNSRANMFVIRAWKDFFDNFKKNKIFFFRNTVQHGNLASKEDISHIRDFFFFEQITYYLSASEFKKTNRFEFLLNNMIE